LPPQVDVHSRVKSRVLEQLRALLKERSRA
jgi:hypothetical protein